MNKLKKVLPFLAFVALLFLYSFFYLSLNSFNGSFFFSILSFILLFLTSVLYKKEKKKGSVILIVIAMVLYFISWILYFKDGNARERVFSSFALLGVYLLTFAYIGNIFKKKKIFLLLLFITAIPFFIGMWELSYSYSYLYILLDNALYRVGCILIFSISFLASFFSLSTDVKKNYLTRVLIILLAISYSFLDITLLNEITPSLVLKTILSSSGFYTSFLFLYLFISFEKSNTIEYSGKKIDLSGVVYEEALPKGKRKKKVKVYDIPPNVPKKSE